MTRLRTHLRLTQLQKKIFLSLQKQARPWIENSDPVLKKYEKEYLSDIKKNIIKAKKQNKRNLTTAIRKADVTLIGDYHTFSQSQKTCIRLIRESAKKGENWAIGLEMISSSFQKELDLYQSEKISTKKFLKLIRFNEEWGFLWKNYEPILTWAKTHKVRLIALNLPKIMYPSLVSTSSEELKQRDRWAAGIITDYFGQMKKCKMIVLYGDMHIAQLHLPKQIREISKNFLGQALHVLSIHQDIPELYWKWAQNKNTNQTQIAKLSDHCFCLLSATPWTKLQSFTSWIETGSFDTETHDFLSEIDQYTTHISEFLEIPKPNLDHVTIKTIENADFIHRKSFKKRLSRSQILPTQLHVIHNIPFYLNEIHTAYLGTASHNKIAEGAALHLIQSQRKNNTSELNHSDDFFRYTIERTFGFLGSLIINPKRKCDLIQDHFQTLKLLKRKKITETYPGESDARTLALYLLGKNKIHSLQIKKMIGQCLQRDKTKFSVMLAARMIGQILAKKLYTGLIEEKLTLTDIKNHFFQPSSSPQLLPELLPQELKDTYFEKFQRMNHSLVRIHTPQSKREIF